MGKINREELFKILDDQYIQCKLALAANLDMNMNKLHNYQGDVIDIKTEISMGNTLEGSLFRAMDEDYYDKQKLLSSVPEKRPSISEDSISDMILAGLHNSTIQAPKQHKKKYLIKLNDKLTDEQAEAITGQINRAQFVIYKQDTIEQIITLDVE